MGRDEVAEEAARVAGTVNNLIPNLETHVKEANEAKPLERKQHVVKVQEYVKRLEDERKKMEGIIKTFRALSPNTDPNKQKTGIKGVVAKLNSNNRADGDLVKKMEAALKDIDVAIKNGNEFKIASWKPLKI